MTATIETNSECLPVVTPTMRWWLSWIAGGGSVIRTVGTLYTQPSRKRISYAMAEQLVESGAVCWEDKPVDRYPIKREHLVMTDLGRDIVEGRVVPPSSSPAQRQTLGKKQLDGLRCLEERGPWAPLGIMSGWVLDNDSGTLRVMESLEKRGLVDRRSEPLANGKRIIERFYINDAGRKARGRDEPV